MFLFSVATTLAQPVGGIDVPGVAGVETDFKTPPLRDSDVFTVPLAIHNQDAGVVLNWAGALVGVHVLDNQEVDIDGINSPWWPSLIPSPFGDRSENVQSVMAVFQAWHPNAQNSGIDLQQSQNMHVFDVTLHAKNTDPINNTDQDIGLRFWNIRHLGAGPGGISIFLDASDWVYGTEFFNPIQASFFPPNPPAPGDGTWYLLAEPKTFQTVGAGSAFVATLANTAAIGVEHVPEPAGFVLVICGAGAAGMAWTVRRRRKHRAA